jgi:hypothetical protein
MDTETKRLLIELTAAVAHLCRVAADPEPPNFSDQARLREIADRLDIISQEFQQ